MRLRAKTRFYILGTIVQCRVVKNANSSQGQGIAFVLYTNRDEALAAIKVHISCKSSVVT